MRGLRARQQHAGRVWWEIEGLFHNIRINARVE